MSKKRDRLEVVKDILEIIKNKNNKIKPTPLLRYSNLSSQSFNEYFKELILKNLIQTDLDKNGRKHISLTEKGFHYIEKYKSIKEFIKEFDL